MCKKLKKLGYIPGTHLPPPKKKKTGETGPIYGCFSPFCQHVPPLKGAIAVRLPPVARTSKSNPGWGWFFWGGLCY